MTSRFSNVPVFLRRVSCTQKLQLKQIMHAKPCNIFRQHFTIPLLTKSSFLLLSICHAKCIVRLLEFEKDIVYRYAITSGSDKQRLHCSRWSTGIHLQELECSVLYLLRLNLHLASLYDTCLNIKMVKWNIKHP